MKNNIGLIKDCFGCTVCASACPHDVIKIQEIDGFLKPVILNESDCTECGICHKICSYCDDTPFITSASVRSYSGYSSNHETVYSCTSGGVAYELLRRGVEKGYKVVSVRYNYDNNRPQHFICENFKDLDDSKGSKYIQSDLSIALKKLKSREKYIIIGTPCQIASVKKYLNLKKIENNVILIDFFCHGVPSAKVWDAYRLQFVSALGEVKKYIFRPKDYGWHNSTRVKMIGEKGSYIMDYQKEDPFFKMFLANRCLAKACYDKCKYKQTHSYADIRLGDLWGTKFIDNVTGVSGILAMTDKGAEFLLDGDDVILNNEPINVILNGQMKRNARRSPSYQVCKIGLKLNMPFRLLYCICNNIDWIYYLPQRVFSKIKYL